MKDDFTLPDVGVEPLASVTSRMAMDVGDPSVQIHRMNLRFELPETETDLAPLGLSQSTSFLVLGIVKQLHRLAIDALDQGKDFVYGRYEMQGPLAPEAISAASVESFQQQKLVFTVRGGAVCPGVWESSREWTVISHEKWMALSEEERQAFRDKVAQLGA